MAGIIIPNSAAGGKITDASGNEFEVATVFLTPEQARIMREYKKVLMTLGMVQATFCGNCPRHDREDAMRGHVADGEIVLHCRCTMWVYKGQTF